MAGKAGGKQAGAGGASVPGKGTPAIDGTTKMDAATLDAIIDGHNAGRSAGGSAGISYRNR